MFSSAGVASVATPVFFRLKESADENRQLDQWQHQHG
jgi:hypothetical protein